MTKPQVMRCTVCWCLLREGDVEKHIRKRHPVWLFKKVYVESVPGMWKVFTRELKAALEERRQQK